LSDEQAGIEASENAQPTPMTQGQEVAQAQANDINSVFNAQITK
jgi:hypothetical protein